MEPVTPRELVGEGDETKVAGQRAPNDSGDRLRPPADEDATTSTRINDGFELVPGTSLGEYQIEGKIGEGGMGVVFAAVHPVIGKRVAVKVLKKELCNDASSVARFVDEARAVNRIGHPNIVDIFAFGEVSGRCYMAMEWLKGESLRHRVDRGPLTVSDACTVLKALALALGAAHAKGVIHRDLKPDNVFLSEVEGEPSRVKLLDFGLAKLGHADREVTRTEIGAMLGTPQYVAPEQAKGHAIDHRVDIYALGVVAFELLTGRPPFVADNAAEMVAMHLMEPPPRASAYAPEVPRDLDALIDAMLSKDAGARPTLEEISATIELVAARALQPTIIQSVPIRSTTAKPLGVATAVTRIDGDPTKSLTSTFVIRHRPRAGRSIALVIVALVTACAIALVIAYVGDHELATNDGTRQREAETAPPTSTSPEPTTKRSPSTNRAEPLRDEKTALPTAPLSTEQPATNGANVPVDSADANAAQPPTATKPSATNAANRRVDATATKAPPVRKLPPAKKHRDAQDRKATGTDQPKIRKAPKDPAPESEPPAKLPDDGLVAPGTFGGRR